jgi:hypothetical protein
MPTPLHPDQVMALQWITAMPSWMIKVTNFQLEMRVREDGTATLPWREVQALVPWGEMHEWGQPRLELARAFWRRHIPELYRQQGWIVTATGIGPDYVFEKKQ